jgi:hypothetical protein
MASRSNTSDATRSDNTTSVVDRRAVQQQGQQILDSVIVSSDNKVVAAALAEARQILGNMSSAQGVTVQSMLSVLIKIQDAIGKGQADISRFGLDALEKARRELEGLRASGDMYIRLADQTVNNAMSITQQVAESQARNQAIALEILADTKTGDPADLVKTITAMVLLFALGAILILEN